MVGAAYIWLLLEHGEENAVVLDVAVASYKYKSCVSSFDYLYS
jgi:hypothetical protein